MLGFFSVVFLQSLGNMLCLLFLLLERSTRSFYRGWMASADGVMSQPHEALFSMLKRLQVESLLDYAVASSSFREIRLLTGAPGAFLEGITHSCGAVGLTCHMACKYWGE